MQSHQLRPMALASVLVLAAAGCGVSILHEANQALADSIALARPQGARMTSAAPAGHASHAGLRPRDLILSIEADARWQSGRMRVVRTSLLFWADGMTVAPGLVIVHPRVRSGSELLAHEAVHCRQMREVGLLRFWWLYLTSPDFRLEAEAEAYRISLRYEPGGIRHFARALAHGYLLGITPERAELLLRA